MAELPPIPRKGVSLPFMQKVRDIVVKIDKNITTTQVCDFFIKPLTESSKTAFMNLDFSQFAVERTAALVKPPDFQLIYDESFQPNPMVVDYCCSFFRQYFDLEYKDCFHDKADVFISHAWKYNFSELVDAIETFFYDHSDSMAPENTYLWFDLFLNNQWEAANLPFEWWCGTFRTAVKEISHTCVILLPWNNPIPLTRSWCLWEIFSTIVTGSRLTIQLSSTQKKQFLETLRDNFHMVVSIFGNIDVSQSIAFKKDQQEQILEAVEKSEGGSAKVNNIIAEGMRQWMRDVARLEAAKVDAEYEKFIAKAQQNNENFDIHVAHRTTEKLAQLLAAHGKFMEAYKVYDELLKQKMTVLGNSHPETLKVFYQQGRLMMQMHRKNEAKQLFSMLFVTQQISFDPLEDNMDIFDTITALATLSEPEEALQLYESVIRPYEVKFGRFHKNTIHAKLNVFCAEITQSVKHKDFDTFVKALKHFESLQVELQQDFNNMSEEKKQDNGYDYCIKLASICQRFASILLFAVPTFGMIHALSAETLLRAGIDILTPIIGKTNLQVIQLSEQLMNLLVDYHKEFLRMANESYLPEQFHLLTLRTSEEYEKEIQLLQKEIVTDKRKILGLDHESTQQTVLSLDLIKTVQSYQNNPQKETTLDEAKSLLQLTERMDQFHFGGSIASSATMKTPMNAKSNQLLEVEQQQPPQTQPQTQPHENGSGGLPSLLFSFPSRLAKNFTRWFAPDRKKPKNVQTLKPVTDDHSRISLSKEPIHTISKEIKLSNRPDHMERSAYSSFSCIEEVFNELNRILQVNSLLFTSTNAIPAAHFQIVNSNEPITVSATVNIIESKSIQVFSDVFFYTSTIYDPTNNIKNTDHDKTEDDQQHFNKNQIGTSPTYVTSYKIIPLTSLSSVEISDQTTLKLFVDHSSLEPEQLKVQFMNESDCDIITRQIIANRNTIKFMIAIDALPPYLFYYQDPSNQPEEIQQREGLQCIHKAMLVYMNKLFAFRLSSSLALGRLTVEKISILQEIDSILSFCYCLKRYQCLEETIILCETLFEMHPKVFGIDSVVDSTSLSSSSSSSDSFIVTNISRKILLIYRLFAEALTFFMDPIRVQIKHIRWISEITRKCFNEFGNTDSLTVQLMCYLADLVSRDDLTIRTEDLNHDSRDFLFCCNLEKIAVSLEHSLEASTAEADLTEKKTQITIIWMYFVLLLARHHTANNYKLAEEIIEKKRLTAASSITEKTIHLVIMIYQELTTNRFSRRTANNMEDFQAVLAYKNLEIDLLQQICPQGSSDIAPLPIKYQIALQTALFTKGFILNTYQHSKEAVDLLRGVVKERERLLGLYHPHTLNCIRSLHLAAFSDRQFQVAKDFGLIYIERKKELGEANEKIVIESQALVSSLEMILQMPADQQSMVTNMFTEMLKMLNLQSA